MSSGMIPVRGSISGRTAASPELSLRSAPQRPAHAVEPDPLVEDAVESVRLALLRFEGNVTAALGRRSAALGPVPSAAEAHSRRCAGFCGPENGPAVSHSLEPGNVAGAAP